MISTSILRSIIYKSTTFVKVDLFFPKVFFYAVPGNVHLYETPRIERLIVY